MSFLKDNYRVMKRFLAMMLCGVLLLLLSLPVGAEATERQRGDVDGNGKIEAYDALLVLRYVVGKYELTNDELQIYANVDSALGVHADDALWILKYIVSDQYGIIGIYQFIHKLPPNGVIVDTNTDYEDDQYV